MLIKMNSDLHYTINVENDAIIGGRFGAAGMVNNHYNTDNSRTINQTNTSPESLSRP